MEVFLLVVFIIVGVIRSVRGFLAFLTQQQQQQDKPASKRYQFIASRAVRPKVFFKKVSIFLFVF
jgi:hypothetical protein